MTNRVKRLIYRSNHRGCKETDVLLGSFANACLYDFTEDELDEYEAFISENDWDIFAWLTQEKPLPDQHHNPTVDKLLHFPYPEHMIPSSQT